MTTRAPMPKRITAQNGQVFEVDVISRKAMNRCAGLPDDADGPVGMTLVLDDRIVILKMASDAQQRLTLWHEVLHVAAYFGQSDGHPKATKRNRYDHDELIASSIDSTSLDLLRNNPELVAYLLW